MITLGRVVGVHPEANAVDVEMMMDGRRIAGIQCMSQICGTDFGMAGMDSPGVSGYDKNPNGVRDIIAVVTFMGSQPLVLGFLFPQVCQLLFEELGRYIFRHSSDVYTTISPNGDAEFYHPSGAFVRFGESTAHEDLTGKDYDGKWKIIKNTGRKVSIHVEQAGGTAAVTIDPDGNFFIEHDGDLWVKTGGKASFSSGGDMSFTAPNITLTGATEIDGSLTQGKGEAGGEASFLGPVAVDNDLVANGVSVSGHTHTEQGDGHEVSTPN